MSASSPHSELASIVRTALDDSMPFAHQLIPKEEAMRALDSLEEQLETAHEALLHIAGWAQDELRDGPPELGLILGEARRVLGDSTPASQPWKYGDPIKGSMTVSNPASRPENG